LVVVRISNFGQHGPFRDRVATSLTLQAASGWVSPRDPDRPPVQAGARVAQDGAGGYAALGALTALRIASRSRVTEVDVSVLEALLSTLPYPLLMAERMRTLGLPSNTRAAVQGTVAADAECRAGGRRLRRDQLPDRAALARRVRHVRPAGVWRAAVR